MKTSTAALLLTVALAGFALTLVGSVRTGAPTQASAYRVASDADGEAGLVLALRSEADLEPVSDADLVAAGRAACAALDRGAPYSDVLVAVAGTAPATRSMRAVEVVVHVAAERLCPEHAP